MSADAVSAARSEARGAPPWDLVLLGLTALTLALIPVHIHRAFGLPAHPLLLHVPVILVPLAGLAALAFCARPAWLDRYGLGLGVLAVVTALAVAAIFFVIRTGHLGAK